MFLFILTCPLSFSSILPETTANKTTHEMNKMNDFTCSKLIAHLMLFGTRKFIMGLGVDLRNSNFIWKRESSFIAHMVSEKTLS